MAVRVFNGTSDNLVCSPGAVASMTYGTFAFLTKQTASRTLEVNSFALQSTSPTDLRCVAATTGTGTLRGVFFNDADYDDTSGVASALNQWCLWVFRKGTGSTTGRWSCYNYNTTTWTHFNTIDTSLADFPAIGGTGQISFYDGDQYPPIKIAARAAWVNNVKWSADSTGDAQIEAAGLEDALSNWVTAAPDLLHAFNQASTATAVTDLIGDSDETSITGTSVDTGDDPPGFSFDLSGGVNGVLTANLSGLTAAIAGTHEVPGSMVISLGSLTATLAGTPTVTGTMAIQLGALSATIQGTLEAKGLLSASFTFLANVVGDRTHFGSGAATLGALTATMVGGGGLAYLITTADIEDALGRAAYNAAEEAAWQQAIVVVSNYINSKVRVGFATTTVTATYQADSYGCIYLREPVTNISSIKNYRTQEEDLWVDFDGVYKLFNLEPQQVVVVTYTYGYSEPPQDIQDLATTLAIAQINESSAPVGLRRYKVGDVEEQYTGDGTSRHILDDMINGVLDNYRRRWYSIPLSLEYFPDYTPRGFEDDFGS